MNFDKKQLRNTLLLLLGALIWWRTRPRALLAHPDRPTWHADAGASAKARKEAT